MGFDHDNATRYRLFKALRGRKPILLDTGNATAIEALRDRYKNQDLLVSPWYTEHPDFSATRTWPVYFHITAPDVETTRVNALEAIYYITEDFSIPAESIDILYDGGGQAGPSPDPADHSSSVNAKGGTTAAAIIISIPPAVFGGQPTPLMPALNHHLARRMAEDAIKNLDIDVYRHDHLVPLPNSVNTATGRFAIPLGQKELLYLDAKTIAELAQRPKPEDSLVMPRPVPEAIEWYVETLAEFENNRRQQDALRKRLLDAGWQIPPCIRRLMQLCLYDHNRLEAYRVISFYFAWIGANPVEIRHLVYTVDRRNPVNDHQKINAIITFAVENPGFPGCRHPLLHRFCPAGRCFMVELIEEYNQPQLFTDHRQPGPINQLIK